MVLRSATGDRDDAWSMALVFPFFGRLGRLHDGEVKPIDRVLLGVGEHVPGPDDAVDLRFLVDEFRPLLTSLPWEA